ncbi:MAG: RhuM family protein [Terracidiphilus sp.]
MRPQEHLCHQRTEELATIRKNRIVQTEGAREVAREVDFDAIIAVGYTVNSRQATQFRIWTTQVLRNNRRIFMGQQRTMMSLVYPAQV